MDIDKLNVAIFTSIGVVFEGLDEIETPFKNKLDELRTDLSSLDELRVSTAHKRAAEVLKDVPPMTMEQKSLAKKLIDDDFLEYLVFAYTEGISAVGAMLEGKAETNTDSLFLSVNRATEGKTWKERAHEAIDNDSLGNLLRLGDTEFHRVFNESIEDGAKQLGARYKKWRTMNDDKVRDSHDYLNGMEVGIDESFYTYDGDSAPHPGGFSSASNNCNCRCYIDVSR